MDATMRLPNDARFLARDPRVPADLGPLELPAVTPPGTFVVNVFSAWLRRAFFHRIARIAGGSA
jgi:hypothetical protein